MSRQHDKSQYQLAAVTQVWHSAVYLSTKTAEGEGYVTLKTIRRERSLGICVVIIGDNVIPMVHSPLEKKGGQTCKLCVPERTPCKVTGTPLHGDGGSVPGDPALPAQPPPSWAAMARGQAELRVQTGSRP